MNLILRCVLTRAETMGGADRLVNEICGAQCEAPFLVFNRVLGCDQPAAKQDVLRTP
jgi:hypothetical protein